MPTTRGRVMSKGKAAAPPPTPKTPTKKQPDKSSPLKRNSPKSAKKSAQTPSKAKAKAPTTEEPEEKERAAVQRSMIPENLAGWLPAKYIQWIVTSKNREEWRAKVRWLVAVLFFRCRFFAPTTVRAILLALQPTDSQVLVSTSPDNIGFFKDLVAQLHDRIWQPHAELAKLFLHETGAGINYIQGYQKQSEGHRLRSKMTIEGLELSLSLTINDVRGLWTAIEYTAHSECWIPTSKNSRIYIEALRHASYGMMARIINHWLRGSQHASEISLSTTVRTQDFQSTMDVNSPPTWPKPPPRGERPSSLEEWLECPHYYPSASKNTFFNALIERIKKENADRIKNESAGYQLVTGGPQQTLGDDSSSDSSDSLTELDSDDFDDEQGKPHHLLMKVEIPEQYKVRDSRSAAPKTATRAGGQGQEDSQETQNRTLIFQHIGQETPTSTPSPAARAGRIIPSKIASPYHRRLDIEPGPSPLFQSSLNQPADLDGDDLPGATLNSVKNATAEDRAERRRIMAHLKDECMDDAWYESSEAAYIASLSSIGKAEYAMHCLDRDIERWSHAIWAMNERKLADEKLMVSLKEKREKAIQRQKLISDLETTGVAVNQAAMEMSRSHRLRDQRDAGNRNEITYTQASRHLGPPAQIRYISTNPAPQLESAPRRQSGHGISSSPFNHPQSQYSPPGSPKQPAPGHDIHEARSTSYSVHGRSDLAGEAFRGPYSQGIQHGDTSGGVHGHKKISQSSKDPERRKRKLERREKREIKKAKLFVTKGPFPTHDGIGPHDDEYYAQPLVYRQIPYSSHESDYLATSEGFTDIRTSTTTTPGIGASGGKTPGVQDTPTQTPPPANEPAAPPPSSQSMTYGDFSSRFDPQVRTSAQAESQPIAHPSQPTGNLGDSTSVPASKQSENAEKPAPSGSGPDTGERAT